MEERRLKTILSHLSACPPSQMGKSSFLNATSKAEKHTLLLPGSTHLQQKKQVARTSISRSKSSSDMMESRLVGLGEVFPARGDAWNPASREELLSHGHSLASPTKHRCGGWNWSRKHPPEEIEGSLCMGMPELTKMHTPGDSLEATVSNLMQGRRSNCLHRDCSPSGAAKLEWSLQCNSSHMQHKQTVDFEGKQIDTRCSSPFDQRVAKHQSQAPDALPCSSGDGDRLEIVLEPQISSRTSDIVGNTEECDIQTVGDLHILESQSAEVANDAVGSISRNNAMTGQRRRIVEDCIFCLIIQGQSPAFKLYEDDMCVCILDVHPLSHGHSLLIPKAHFPSLELTPPEVAAAMCATVPLLSMAIMQATNCDSFNLLVNSGKAAGQVVFHTHFHIIPRRTGDNLWRSEDGNRRFGIIYPISTYDNEMDIEASFDSSLE
ncbi:hypothetical protein GOP47_0023489 [Adiantum capillus-veneris]|uniref:HIT domain-containing protein n=1 Tax=Adiantum capillus-veneris TaxID=13818 RepID=A0A9D4Z4I1_ADICA|nr:hypothetical protein GOP47_0023489 [Adiantum capillus-veneris]